MKKLSTILLTVVIGLSLQGCLSAEWDQYKDLDSRMKSLEQLADEMNEDIAAMEELVGAMNEKLFIRSFMQNTKDGKNGFVILLSNNKKISLYNGRDGYIGSAGSDANNPRITAKLDVDGKYYWAITYSIYTASTFIYDSNGNKIRCGAVNGQDGKDGKNAKDGKPGADGKPGVDGTDGANGISPRLKIVEGYWYLSVDGGTYWTKLTPAIGDDGKSYFSDVVVNSVDGYVEFLFLEGGSIKLPLYDHVMKVIEQKEESINGWIETLGTLMKPFEEAVFITGVEPAMSADSLAVGYTVHLNNGNDFDITVLDGNDGAEAPAFYIGTLEDTDGTVYWGIKVGDAPMAFLKDASGSKIQAVAKDGAETSCPVVKAEENNGTFYWKVTVNGKSDWLLDKDGNRIAADGGAGDTWLDSIDTSDPDFILFKTVDDVTYKFPTYSYHQSIATALQQCELQIAKIDSIAKSIQGYQAISGIDTLFNSENEKAGIIITFTDNKKITITDGENASYDFRANIPIIGVKKFDVDYYWTIRYGAEGTETYILDEKGSKVRAIGHDTTDSPKIGIDNDGGVYYWIIKPTSSSEWITLLGPDGQRIKVQGSDYAGTDPSADDSLFESITQDEYFVYIKLKGEEDPVKIAKYKDFKVSVTDIPDYIIRNTAEYLTVTIEGAVSTPQIEVLAETLFMTDVSEPVQDPATKVYTAKVMISAINAVKDNPIHLFVTDGKDKLFTTTLHIESVLQPPTPAE